jgi:MFS family permease
MSTATYPQPSTPRDDPHYQRRWLILGVILLAQLMLIVDLTIVNVALPSAQRALHFSTANREWIISAYTLAFGSLLPLGGRMADLLGRKRMFIIGAIGFAAACAGGGAAGGFVMFVVARAGQGLFAALLAPAAMSMIGVTFTQPTERARAVGAYGAISGGAGALGLLLGGVFTSYVSWRWCMFLNVPFGVIAVLGSVSLMHDTPAETRQRPGVFSTALVTGGLFGIVFGAAQAQSHGWGATITLVSLFGGGALLGTFLLVQARITYPLVPLHVMVDRNRGSGLLAVFLGNVAVSACAFLFLTYYMQGVLHYSPIKTGLAFLPLALGIGIAATLVQGKLVTRFPARAFVVVGQLIGAAGFVLLAQLGTHSSYVGWLLSGMVLIGLGFGTSVIVAIDMSSFGVAPEDTGAAGSLTNVSQQIGTAVGIAVLSTVAASATDQYVRTHAAATTVAAHATVHGFTVAFWCGAVIFAATAVICAPLIRRGTRTAVATDIPMEAEAVANTIAL